jgi:hypothetical protein
MTTGRPTAQAEPGQRMYLLNPYLTYSDQGWQGWGDWFGTGNRAPTRREWRPFHDARQFARNLGLRSAAEWRAYQRTSARPHDIPSNPNVAYVDQGWRSWGDWLGTGTINQKQWRPFSEARAFVHELGLTSLGQWHAFSRSGGRPLDIPSNPNVTYGNQGWQGWPDWLGAARRRKQREGLGREQETPPYTNSRGG